MRAPLPFRLLFENDDVLVIDKPTGLVVHRGFSGERDSVVDRLRQTGWEHLHTVHRLDRATSGALVLATNPRSARALAEAFAGGTVKKTYVTIVRGLAPDDVFVDHAIPCEEGGERVPAQTQLTRLATVLTPSTLREPRYSLVRASPRTGRFHQVRRHLAHLRHPIVGDTNYGKGEHNRYCREAFGLVRLALHAETITLPAIGERPAFTVTSPLPDDLAHALTRMGFSLGSLQLQDDVGEAHESATLLETQEEDVVDQVHANVLMGLSQVTTGHDIALVQVAA